MQSTSSLSDFEHPSIQEKAGSLTAGRESPMEKLESIFLFVRDDIPFGFTPKWDEARASEILGFGMGYCNTKATLLIALCRASGIPARAHCGLISIEVMRGIFPGLAFPILPDSGSHTWTEVQIEGEWKPVDSYINDRAFYEAGLRKLRDSGRSLGYSISPTEGKSSCELNFGEKGFVQMGAVIEDHGSWNDLSHYVSSDGYTTFSSFQMLFYPAIARICNRRIERIRSGR
jgi:hypothetical protein